MAPRIRVSPTVVFSILDHHIRRNENQENVIGALMGGKAPDGCMEIRHCLPIPHLEGDAEMAIDNDFQRTMSQLFQKVDTKNFMVGWYATFYSETSQTLHNYYVQNIPNAIFLLVDPTMQSGALNIKALVSQSLTLGDMTIKGFKEMSFEWKIADAAKIALATMMQQRVGKEAEEDEDEVIRAVQPWETLQVTMARLHANLSKALAYVTRILNGEVKEDKNIGRALSAVISQVPMVSPQTFDRVFNDSLQDMLMVIYLSKLTRAQLALHEKLHSTITPAFLM